MLAPAKFPNRWLNNPSLSKIDAWISVFVHPLFFFITIVLNGFYFPVFILNIYINFYWMHWYRGDGARLFEGGKCCNVKSEADDCLHRSQKCGENIHYPSKLQLNLSSFFIWLYFALIYPHLITRLFTLNSLRSFQARYWTTFTIRLSVGPKIGRHLILLLSISNVKPLLDW